MTAAIVWLILWLVLAFVGAWLVIALTVVAGAAIAAAKDALWVAPVAVFLGWLLGIAWFVFAAVQFALQIGAVVELATA